jgi:tetratricopeptide (TPR) repeat protein
MFRFYGPPTEEFFATAVGISRDMFVETYGDVAKLSQLMLAPLGVGSQASASSVLGDEVAQEEYMRLFRKWEEVISRSVYAAKKISEDRVAASMHLFLEMEKDSVVLGSIRQEAANVNAILSPPSVVALVEAVELTEMGLSNYQNLRKKYGIDEGGEVEVPEKDAWILGTVTNSEESRQLNLNTPEIATHLMKRVLLALRLLFDSVDASQLPASWGDKYALDKAAAADGISVRRYAFTPHDVLLFYPKKKEEHEDGAGEEKKEKATTIGIAAEVTDTLMRSLQVAVPDSDAPLVTVTVQQYFALLDAHGRSPSVERALASLFHLDVKEENSRGSTSTAMPPAGSPLCLLDRVRIGAYEHLLADPFVGTDLSTTLALSAPYSPVASALTQLGCKGASTSSSSSDEEGEGVNPAETKKARALGVLVASNQLMAAQADAAKVASSVEAGKILEKALKSACATVLEKAEGEDESSSSEDEDEDEVEDDSFDQEEVLQVLVEAIPETLLASVLTDRASNLVSHYNNLLTEAMSYAASFPDGESEDPNESTSLQTALQCVDFAIARRPYDGSAYAVRSQIHGLFGMREIEEREMELMEGLGGDDDGDGEGREECAHLKAAAKDALAAFHIGGSSDLALAGSAEDACRQASRLAAKLHYKDKMNDIRGSAASGQHSSGENEMPLQWLVQAYLCGYEPPSLALSVPLLAIAKDDGLSGDMSIDCGYLTLEDVKAPYKRCKGSSSLDDSGMNDIDDEGVVDNSDHANDPYLALLPMPPAGFLDSPDGDNDGESGVIMTGLRYDRQAFHLLRHLVTLLEGCILAGMTTATSDGNSSSRQHDNFSGSSGDDVKKAMRGMERFIKKETSVDDDDAVPGVNGVNVKVEDKEGDFLSNLTAVHTPFSMVAHGVCVVEEGEAVDSTAGSRGSSEAMTGIDITGDKAAVASTSVPVCKQVCTNFVEVSRILHMTATSKFTGVSFCPITHLVKSVAPVVNSDDDDNDAVVEVSVPIRARLLNLCSVTAYLLGDAEGAVSCLRCSLDLLPVLTDVDLCKNEAYNLDPCGLLDSGIKLGALLCDMDEREEAEQVLTSVHMAAERIGLTGFLQEQDDEEGVYLSVGEAVQLPARGQTGYLGCQAVAMLHLAELSIHRMSLDEAQMTLSRASRLVTRVTRDGPDSLDWRVWSRFAAQLDTNVQSLLGVVLFRKNPEDADQALRLLKRACSEAPDSLYLHLSYGEVLGQAGDLVGSLACFHQAHTIDPTHPLPFVNAARTYQQLSQTATAKKHLDRALELDPSFSLTYIDVAQAALQAGETEKALQILDRALVLARHVSDLLDVLTAKRVAELQLCLQQEGLYVPPVLV